MQNNKIKELQTTIEELQRQLADLRVRVSEVEEQSEEQIVSRRRRDIQVGDRVRVLNNYRGLGNTTATVISITESQAKVRGDRGGTIFRRYKQNLEIVKNE